MKPRKCAAALDLSDAPEPEEPTRLAVVHREEKESGAGALDWRALEDELEALLATLTGEKSELAQAKTLSRAKTVYEAAHPEARHGGARNQDANAATCPSFAAYAAARCGYSVRTIYNRLDAAADLEALDAGAERAAYGTAAANKVEFLRRVARLPEPGLHLDLVTIFDISQKKGRRELRKWEEQFGLTQNPKPAMRPTESPAPPQVEAGAGDAALLARIRRALGVEVDEEILPAIKQLKKARRAVLALRAKLTAAERRAGRPGEEPRIYASARPGIDARASEAPRAEPERRARASARVGELGVQIDTVHRGDCLALMRKMRSGCVDAVVTSPPYNLRNSSGGGLRNGSGGLWSKARLLRGYTENGDDMPRAAYVEWQRACLTEMVRLLKDDGAIYYVHKRRVQDGLEEDPRLDILRDSPVRQTITWQRAGGINFNRGYFLPTTECVYMICKSARFRLARAACSWGDVWSIPQEGGSNEHPTPFPVELALRCIQATDARVVLDPFLGSGTTAIAAETLGRHWIGIELSQVYVDQANERLRSWRSGALNRPRPKSRARAGARSGRRAAQAPISLRTR